MFRVQSAEESLQSQKRHWDRLEQGAMFLGAYESIYLVVEKQIDSIKVINLDREARLGLIQGRAELKVYELKFGDIEIVASYPLPAPKSTTSDLFAAAFDQLSFLDQIVEVPFEEGQLINEARRDFGQE